MTLSAEREALKATLSAADIQAFAAVPARLTPPAAVIVPGSPYIEQGDTFGAAALRFNVWLAAPGGDIGEDTLDGLIDTAIATLAADDWVIEGVSQPFDWSHQGGNHLTSIISIRGEIPFPTA